jgi:hypothetical protein
MIPAYLYHVTLDINTYSIRVYGIDVRRKYPSRNDPANYFVDANSVAWAIAHTSGRHYVNTNNLHVYKVSTQDRPFTKFFGKGLYVIKQTVLLHPGEQTDAYASMVLNWIRDGADLNAQDWNDLPF